MSQPFSADPPARRNLLERLLGIFTRVLPGEGLPALLLLVNVLLLMIAYYILKTVREGLILGGDGYWGIPNDQLKIYTSTVTALLLLPVLPAYGRLASRVPRIPLLTFTGVLVIGSLCGFIALGLAGVAIGLPYVIWLGMVSVFLIAQFWSYANDVYSEAQGKRLFPVIAVGAALGAIVGPVLAHYGRSWVYGLMGLAALLLGLNLLLFNIVDRLPAIRAAADAQQADRPLSATGGFQLVWDSKYLLLIAAMVMLLNQINSTGEYILANAVTSHAEQVHPDTANPADDYAQRTTWITGVYGAFYFWVNLASFAIQALLVSRLLRWLGVGGSLLIAPAIAIGAYLGIGWIGTLAVVRIAKLTENAVDYSLQNTVRHTLFLPTSRETKYKAKAVLDTFFMRFGDTAGAALVFFASWSQWAIGSIAFFNVGLAAGWMLIAVGIGRQYAHALDRNDDPVPAAASTSS